jgi:hypothetical protein
MEPVRKMALSPPNMYSEILRHDLVGFVQRSFLELNPQTPFLPNWHLEVLASKLEEVRCGKCKRLIVNLPPRHFKSLTCSVAFSAWVLGHDPSKQVLCVCYGQDLSDKFARDSRMLMQSPFYRAIFDARLSEEHQTVAEFETTNGGYRLSTSVGGVVTGRGADLLLSTTR